MSQYKQDFVERKGKILSLMGEMKNFYVGKEDTRQISIIDSWINNLSEDEFSIVVVGEFSAGKSTFLNALMGKKILPSYSNETTATINFLRHRERNGGQEGGCVHYRDGHTESFTNISEATIRRYVSTDSDVAVAKDVEYLELFLDSDFLKDNVTLVDSPGLNGVADKHKDITEEQIEKSSAGIFMFRADQPGSKSDFEFLKNLKDKVNTVFYLINRIDSIKAHENETVESVIQHLKDSYKKQFSSENSIPEIRGIAALCALAARSGTGKEFYPNKTDAELEKASRLKEFEDRLMRFLTLGEKGRMMLITPVKKIFSKLLAEKDNLESSKSELEKSTDSEEISKKIMDIREQKEALEKKVDESKRDISKEVQNLRSEISDFISVEMEKLQQKYVSKLDNWNEISDIENYEAGINSRLGGDLSKINNTVSDKLQDMIQNIVAEKYYDIADKINVNYEELKCDIKLQDKYEFNEADINIGIKNYEAKKAEAKKRIHELEKQLDEVALSAIKRKNAERERKKIEDKIADYEEQKNAYAEIAGPPPKPETYYEEVIEERKRGGWIGKATDALYGAREIPKTVKRYDYTEYDDYCRREKEKKAELNAKQEKLERELNSIKFAGKSEDELNYEKERIQRDIKRAQDEYERERSEFKKEVAKKESKLIREKKNNVMEFIDDTSLKFRDEYRKSLRDKEKLITDVILSAINFEIQRQLSDKEESLKLLNSQLKSSVDERNKIIEGLNNDLETVKDMLKKAIELEAELEGIEKDEIDLVSL